MPKAVYSVMGMTLGIDFDNTIVNYDQVLYKAALEAGLIKPGAEKNKKGIRDSIRKLPDGELQWQILQAHVYGRGMKDSVLSEGVKAFFDACRAAAIRVAIVSHKTQFASMDEGGVNLRDTALRWMREKRFFDSDGLGLSPESVYFESTRREKIERIKSLGCTHFIDDLEETFLEEAFPAGVERILYAQKSSSLKGVKAFGSWKEIYDYFFAGSRQPGQSRYSLHR